MRVEVRRGTKKIYEFAGKNDSLRVILDESVKDPMDSAIDIRFERGMIVLRVVTGVVKIYPRVSNEVEITRESWDDYKG